MKTIIVATDYSSDANNALKYAAALAKQTNAKIVLFNSFELSVHVLNTLLPASAVDELIAANKKRLKDIAFDISDKFGISVESLTRRSFLQTELDYQVERLKADLVVMGMSEAYAGREQANTTTSILQHAKYPVLVVPESASFKGISKILFAFDPDRFEAANKLSMLIDVAEFFNAQVQVYHIEKNKKAITASYCNSASNAAVDIETLCSKVDYSYKDVIEDDVIKGIEQGIKDVEADLLVMVPHHYSFWEGIWHKSKTSNMARRTHVPLLALPNPNLA